MTLTKYNPMSAKEQGVDAEIPQKKGAKLLGLLTVHLPGWYPKGLRLGKSMGRLGVFKV